MADLHTPVIRITLSPSVGVRVGGCLIALVATDSLSGLATFSVNQEMRIVNNSRPIDLPDGASFRLVRLRGRQVLVRFDVPRDLPVRRVPVTTTTEEG